MNTLKLGCVASVATPRRGSLRHKTATTLAIVLTAGALFADAVPVTAPRW